MKTCSSCEYLTQDNNDQHYCGAMTHSNAGPSHQMKNDIPAEVGATWGDFPYFKIDDPNEFGCSIHPDNSLD